MDTPPSAGRQVGRYVLFDEIAAGGMATVHFGRLIGPAGFTRTVAIKRLHPHYAKDPEFVSMFVDEARIAARIRHPNVVPMLDVVTENGEMLLVMEYVSGATLSHLIRALRARGEAVPAPYASAIMVGALTGLHAAHEATGDHGGSLKLVHRDVSPQNILVGTDGVARVADFGIAKAVGRLQTTRDGFIKGKSAYMAPEQIRGREMDRRADIYSAGVVLWEALTGTRLFDADTPLATMNAVLEAEVMRPSAVRATNLPELDAVVMRAIARDVEARYGSALEMVTALETMSAPRLPSAREVGQWVDLVAGEAINRRALRMREIETSASPVGRPSLVPAEQTPPAVPAAPAASPEIEVHTADTAIEHVSDVAKRPRSGLGARTVVLAVVLVCALVGTGVAFRSRHSLDGARRAETEPAAAASIPSSGPPAQPPATSSENVAPDPLPVRPTASAATGTSANSTSVASATRPPAVARPRSPAPDKTRCTPPFTIDASGVKHWKNGC